MADESNTTNNANATPDGAGAPAAAEAGGSNTVPTAIVTTDGKFAEGWKQYIPEEFREEKCLDTFGDLNGLVKSFVYTQRMRGKNVVSIPNENSSEVDWDMFYDAGGRPKTAGDYGLAKPAEVPDEQWDKAAADKFQEFAWKNGLSKKQFDAIVAYDRERTTAALAQRDAGQAQAKQQAEKELRREWGDAYEEKLHLANAFIAKTTPDAEQRAFILKLVGDNPQFIKWVSDWGEKVAESHGIDTSAFKRTPRQIADRIAELNTKSYIDGSMKRENPALFEKTKREIGELTAQQLALEKKSA